MTIGSLFSGIGGLELGLERAGFGPVLWQVEIDPFCRRVLERHWPEAQRYEDVRSVGAATLTPVNLVCGGFPCQDVSSAGSRAGLSGERSGLWFEFQRIVAEMRPTYVVVENVRSGARRWVCPVRDGLHQLGYRTRALGINASDVGAPHRRARVFVVATHPDRKGKSAVPIDAKVAGASTSAANTKRDAVREQPRWRSRQDGSGPPVPRHDGWATPEPGGAYGVRDGGAVICAGCGHRYEGEVHTCPTSDYRAMALAAIEYDPSAIAANRRVAAAARRAAERVGGSVQAALLYLAEELER